MREGGPRLSLTDALIAVAVIGVGLGYVQFMRSAIRELGVGDVGMLAPGQVLEIAARTRVGDLDLAEGTPCVVVAESAFDLDECDRDRLITVRLTDPEHDGDVLDVPRILLRWP